MRQKQTLLPGVACKIKKNGGCITEISLENAVTVSVI